MIDRDISDFIFYFIGIQHILSLPGPVVVDEMNVRVSRNQRRQRALKIPQGLAIDVAELKGNPDRGSF